MNAGKIIFGTIIFIIVMLGLSLGLGWFDVYKTKTVDKAQQNANREVFEQTQSYLEGKRQDLARYHHQWVNADKDSKITIEATIRHEFANVNPDKITDPDMRDFLREVMQK